jgi:hypothetical protein
LNISLVADTETDFTKLEDPEDEKYLVQIEIGDKTLTVSVEEAGILRRGLSEFKESMQNSPWRHLHEAL